MFELREGRLSITPPKEGACPLCGELHGRGEPHNRNSLLYQHRFRQNHGRYPTWEDAMAHCSLTVKKRFCERLKRHGVEVDTGKLLKGLRERVETGGGSKVDRRMD